MHRLKRSVITIFFVFPLVLQAASGGMAGYTARNLGRDTVLTHVVVSRGGRTVGYDASNLIPSAIVHFKSAHTRNVIVPPRREAPGGRGRLGLLGDMRLNTGLINPGTRARALTKAPVLDGPDADVGLAVAFQRPVVNLPGDDVLIFEIQRGDSPLGGDAFHVGPFRALPGTRAVTINHFDIGFEHPCAVPVLPFVPHVSGEPVLCLNDLERLPLKAEVSAGGFKALAVGIDLSALGYADGAAVEGLFLQDAGTSGAQVDPVLVVGLPPPEPPYIMARLPKLPAPPPDHLLAEFLKGPMADVEAIVYAERVPGNDHWYANFGRYWCGQKEHPDQRLPAGWQPQPIFKQGGRLCRLNLRTGRLKVLLDDPEGGVRDPQVYYDATKMVFSYRPGGQSHYHLYEINADGSGLVQLTHGPFDDIEPAYLPDGGIMFCSSRCNRVVNCWRTPVATLYRCDADGSNVRVISTNIEHDNTPWVLPDGQILYMRWEYVDRNQLSFHHLWTINPDGTGQMAFYGNGNPGTALMNRNPTGIPGTHPGIAMLDAKPVPGGHKIVASFSPSHGRPEHMGAVTVVDPLSGPDEQGATRAISKPGRMYRDPYAFSEDCFLVADREGILVMDGRGNTERICRASGGGRLECHEPRPLRPRPREPIMSSHVDMTRGTGLFVLNDIYHGRNMAGVRRGEVKKLLVLEQLPKPVNFSGGPWPLSIGGTFSLARVLGTVPVEPDGSASFEVPALRPVFFVALDGNDLSVKRMQSFASVQPGETIGCVGCHEQRVEPPHGVPHLRALRRPPSRIKPIAGAPDVLDYPRDVQPILDRHCVECHNPDRYDGRVDLSGDHTPLFSVSYWTIIQRGLIADGRNEPYGNRSPRTIGSSASRLLKYLDGSHYKVALSDVEQTIMRLWIDSSATYPGTYAALGSGMTPVAFPVPVMEKRCGKCHGKPVGPKAIGGRGMYFTFGGAGPGLPLVHKFDDLKRTRGVAGYFKFGRSRTPQSLCNLTRPDRSLLLKAPLAAEAGGLALCRTAVFQNGQDNDYRQILAAITDAAKRHQQAKRFDMPGFRPNDHYLIQMRRFGILPDIQPPEGPVDVYAVDRDYWRSFHYQPAGSDPRGFQYESKEEE